jgi:hypothetical protein
MELMGDELVEAGLLAYAHREASKWGAERFAAEFRRRNEEEQRHRSSEERTFGYQAEPDADGLTGLGSVTNGPVASAVSEQAIGSDPRTMDLHRPMRHAHVPRPPTQEPAPKGGRGRRREQNLPQPAPLISPAEAARMSASARRLYGIPDPPSSDLR